MTNWSGTVAVAGIYESPTRKDPDRHPFEIQAECVLGALANAGMSLSDVDGFATAAALEQKEQADSPSSNWPSGSGCARRTSIQPISAAHRPSVRWVTLRQPSTQVWRTWSWSATRQTATHRACNGVNGPRPSNVKDPGSSR